MADSIKLSFGTPITWRDSGGDYGLTMNALASAAARQGAKGDLGANPAPLYAAKLVAVTGTAPTLASGTNVTVYIGWSDNATAADDNPAGLSGSDAAYTGYSSNLDDSILELGIPIIVLPMTALGSQLHRSNMFYFEPRARYAMPVILNGLNQALGAVTTHVLTITPVYDISATV